MQVEGNNISEELEKRYDKAIATARRAAALPHDMRVRVLEATFTAQWAYGAFVTAPTPPQAHNLQTCVEHALAGHRRKGWNPALFWTVVYKGHRFLPKYVVLLQSIAFLRAILREEGSSIQADVEHIRRRVVRLHLTEAEANCSPFHILHRSLTQVGGSWAALHTITLPQDEGDEVFDLKNSTQTALQHQLREFCRRHIIHTLGRPS